LRCQEGSGLDGVAGSGHETVIVDGAGTYVESDAPKEFVAAIRNWTAQRGYASRTGERDL
jgi:haloalkane dehalogenase